MLVTDKFLSLVRLGIGHHSEAVFQETDWQAIEALADKQGLLAIVLDGVEKLPDEMRPPLDTLLEWIGYILQEYEHMFELYRKAIADLAGFYNKHGYKMMVLKGYACSLDWPKPNHRPYGDIDIWMFGDYKRADACVAKEENVEIDSSKHHHTVFEWQDFTVENHYDFINVKRHPSHRGLETIFKELGKECHTEIGMRHQCVEVCGEKVYLPSPNLHALFLLRHALNHFASVGINLRNILDWAFFIEKHTKVINWAWLQSVIDEYHMRDFYNCINAICVEDLGFNPNIFPSVQNLPGLKEKVLNDILDPEFTRETPDGLFQKWTFKYRRWRGNRWKQELCYKESGWRMFWNGLMVNLVKP